MKQICMAPDEGKCQAQAATSTASLPQRIALMLPSSASEMAKKRLNILLQDELLIGSPETHSLCWLPPVSLGKAEADESSSGSS